MKNRNLIRYTLGLAILIALAAGIARAQAPAPNEPGLNAAPDQQPGVGRVSLIQGSVSTQRGDSGEWTAVTPNTPLATGDTISTGPGSRAEVQLDWASVLRLSDGASARIANLSPSQIQIQVGQGTVSYSILQQSEAAVEIDTPNVAIYPQGPGNYRVMVDSDDETKLIVRAGSAEVSTPQGSARVERGQIITVQGPENQQQYQTILAQGPDEWDRWNSDRDRLIAGAQSWQHTNPYYVGSQDLDNYGQWTNVDDYGPVWAPAVAADWAPYRVGRWVWEPFYGWTWVSYEPWGWAPYHYGRWFVRADRWYWWPGPVARGYRPLWAPAYVSFFGFGGGISVGVGFGSVGWLPIGPADPFFPWYGRWGGRANVVNVTNIYNVRNFNEGGRSIGPLAREGMHRYSNIDEAFNNPRMRQGITSMGANQFGRAGVPIHQAAISAESFRGGRLMTGGVPVTPTRESFRATDWAARRDSIPSRAPSAQRFMSNPRGGGGGRPAGQPPAQMSPRGNNFTNPGNNAPGGMRGNAIPSAPHAVQQGPQGRGFNAGSAAGWNRGGAGQGNFGAAPSGGAAASPQAQFSGGGRTSLQAGPATGSAQSSASAQQSRRGGWQGFEGGSRNASPDGGTRNYQSAGAMQPAPSRPAPAFQGGGMRGPEASPRNFTRPALDLRQPIVHERGGSPGGNSMQGGGGNHGGSGGGGGRGNSGGHSSRGR